MLESIEGSLYVDRISRSRLIAYCIEATYEFLTIEQNKINNRARACYTRAREK